MLQKKHPALTRKHQAGHNMKFFTFSCLDLNPDTQTRLKLDPNLIRIRIRRTGENPKMFTDLS
jgi:hypothetical protein